MKKTVIFLLAIFSAVCIMGLASCKGGKRTPASTPEVQSVEDSGFYQSVEDSVFDQSVEDCSAAQSGNKSSSQRIPVEPITEGGDYSGEKYN